MLEQNSNSNTVGLPDDVSSRISGLFAGAFASNDDLYQPLIGAGAAANENEPSAMDWLDRRSPSPRPDVAGTRTYGYDAHGLSVSPAARPRLLEMA